MSSSTPFTTAAASAGTAPPAAGGPVAFLPGSFDPFHNGHLAVVGAAALIFARVIVGVGHNPAKAGGLIDPDQRIDLIAESIAELGNVSVIGFTGLVTAAAQSAGATCLVKGVRTGTDLDVEMVQANTNLATGGIPTVLVPAVGEAALVASRYLREIGTAAGDISSLVPEPVWRAMRAMVATSESPATPKSATPKSATPKSATPKSATQ